MAKWGDLANDNRSAANELFEHRRWRSCVSRAYYAIYSAATEALIQQGIAMPQGHKGPSHGKLPEMIGNHLTAMSHPVRWRLTGLVTKLYDLRVVADYRPDLSVEGIEARVALGLMDRAFRFFRGES